MAEVHAEATTEAFAGVTHAELNLPRCLFDGEPLFCHHARNVGPNGARWVAALAPLGLAGLPDGRVGEFLNCVFEVYSVSPQSQRAIKEITYVLRGRNSDQNNESPVLHHVLPTLKNPLRAMPPQKVFQIKNKLVHSDYYNLSYFGFTVPELRVCDVFIFPMPSLSNRREDEVYGVDYVHAALPRPVVAWINQLVLDASDLSGEAESGVSAIPLKGRALTMLGSGRKAEVPACFLSPLHVPVGYEIVELSWSQAYKFDRIRKDPTHYVSVPISGDCPEPQRRLAEFMGTEREGVFGVLSVRPKVVINHLQGGSASIQLYCSTGQNLAFLEVRSNETLVSVEALAERLSGMRLTAVRG